MRIESLAPVTAVQPAGQMIDTASFHLQLRALPGQFSGQTGERDIDEAVRALNKAAEPFDIALHFNRDEETGAIVVKIVNVGTGEIVRQMPDEAMLHLSAVLGKLQGQLFARTA
jgi:flagellar protein FlaG